MGGIRELAPLVLAAVFFLYQLISSFWLRAYATDVISSDFMPRITGIIALFCIAGILISKYFEAKTMNDSGPPQPPKKRPAFTLMGFIKGNIAITTLVLIGVYIAAMKPLGFILSSFLYLSLQIFLFAPEGKRRPVFTLVLSAVFSVAAYLLFMKGFSILLPPGILG
jgi:hypothetical protein